jgi:hypothetical protein
MIHKYSIFWDGFHALYPHKCEYCEARCTLVFRGEGGESQKPKFCPVDGTSLAHSQNGWKSEQP